MNKPDINLNSTFSYNLTLEIKNYITENTVIVCIGTDKCIGDCLGPLVGSILTENFYPSTCLWNLIFSNSCFKYR